MSHRSSPLPGRTSNDIHRSSVTKSSMLQTKSAKLLSVISVKWCPFLLIPFEIQASKEVTRASGMQTFLALRAEAKKNGVQDLTLDEINEEIRQARYGCE